MKEKTDGQSLDTLAEDVLDRLAQGVITDEIPHMPEGNPRVKAPACDPRAG